MKNPSSSRHPASTRSPLTGRFIKDKDPATGKSPAAASNKPTQAQLRARGMPSKDFREGESFFRGKKVFEIVQIFPDGSILGQSGGRFRRRGVLVEPSDASSQGPPLAPVFISVSAVRLMERMG